MRVALLVVACMVCTITGWTQTPTASSMDRLRWEPVITITDGKTGTVLGSWAVASKRTTAEQSEFERSSGLSCDERVIGGSTEVTITNKLSDQRWLSISLGSPVDGRVPFSFFDGLQAHFRPKLALRQSQIVNRFPMACVWNETAGLVVGVAPLEFHSYLESSFDPTRRTLGYGTRLVLDAGEAETVTFVTYDFPADYGHLGAIQKYWDLFPEAFSPHPNIDPRLRGGEGPTYAYWRHPIVEGQLVPSTEWTRRSRGAKDWCYAPFIRPGDWFVRDEHFDYTVPPGFMEAGFKKAADYHAYRQGLFRSGSKYNSAMCFYVISFCEQTLAEQKYPDSIMTEFPAHPPSVKSYGPERRMWVSNNSFGEAFRRDAADVVAELPTSGFAFDVAGGGPKHYGPGAIASPGRAWDEKGVYAEEGTGQGQLWEYMHTLKAYNGYNMGVWSNPADLKGTYNCMLRSDAFMWEMGTHLPNFDSDGPQPGRYLIGRKSLGFHWSYAGDRLGEKIDWENLDSATLYNLYVGLYDFWLLLSLRDGIMLTTDHCLGNVNLMKHVGALSELCRTGWEPVPAAGTDGHAWIGRYGKGVDSFIAVGNPEPQDQSLTITVDNPWLGDAAYLFQEYFGESILNEATGGKTVLKRTVRMRQPAIFRALLGVRGLPDFKATVGLDDQLADKTIQATITTQMPASVDIISRVPRDCAASSATVNGEAVNVEVSRDGALLKADLKAGDNEVVLNFKSSLFGVRKQALLDFPFVEDRAPRCTIVTGDDPDENEQMVAWKIQDYFRFWYSQAAQPPADIVVPIRKASEVTERRNLVLVGTPESNPIVAEFAARIEPPGPNGTIQLLEPEDVLWLAGPSSWGTRDVLWRMLYALDEKYPYIGEFPNQVFAAQSLPTAELRRKAGLSGPGAVLK